MITIHLEVKNFYKDYDFDFQDSSEWGALCFIEEKVINNGRNCRCIASQNIDEEIIYYYPPGGIKSWTEQEMLKLIKLKAFL